MRCSALSWRHRADLRLDSVGLVSSVGGSWLAQATWCAPEENFRSSSWSVLSSRSRGRRRNRGWRWGRFGTACGVWCPREGTRGDLVRREQHLNELPIGAAPGRVVRKLPAVRRDLALLRTSGTLGKRLCRFDGGQLALRILRGPEIDHVTGPGGTRATPASSSGCDCQWQEVRGTRGFQMRRWSRRGRHRGSGGNRGPYRRRVQFVEVDSYA